MIKKFSRYEEILLVTTLVLMVIFIFGQVIGRYIFQSAPSWTEEAARYIHIFQVWLGASYAVKLREHIRVDAFVTLFHGTLRKILEVSATLIWFLFAIFLAVYGTQLVFESMRHGQVSPAMQIPFWIPYLAISLGCGGMVIRLVIQLIDILKTKYEKPKKEEITL